MDFCAAACLSRHGRVSMSQSGMTTERVTAGLPAGPGPRRGGNGRVDHDRIGSCKTARWSALEARSTMGERIFRVGAFTYGGGFPR